ncbi:amidohydrolase family protein [Aurantiacibacter sp. MUD11]|uniref:amidohydrolase family protein n=1 Tax=Aurantiacibacter sp. MUD11 TaxID=3003265 RepID=UPI0022AA3B98|nr:amidohydrolase family protein [Aurantiacibacter sp. MUD11]WAT16884.1 amidohydrolase family protein [Aurantiacibacter sp. MUD11]
MRSLFATALLAAAVPAAAQDALLLTNVGPDGHSIFIEDGVIVANGGSILPPEKGRTVDVGGAFVTPGLIDMHVHVWGEAELAAYLAHGVTTVRNLSGMPFHLRMAEAIEAGTLEGPRLLTSGPILNSPGPNAQINHVMAATAEEARAAVRAQHEAGYTRIKLYSNLTGEAFAAALAEAEALGMMVTGHPVEGAREEGIPFERDFLVPIADTLAAGFETIEHTESIAFHGLRSTTDREAGEQLVADLVASGSPVTPTLVAHRNLVRVAESQGAYASRTGTEWLNPVTQQTEAANIAAWASRDPAYEAGQAEFYSWMTGAMQDAGVLLVAGSDAGIFTNIPGDALHDELELLVEAGLTPAEAVDTATANAARVLGEEGRLGCTGAGCAAEIVFTACDPRADIACIRQVVGVVRNGRWHGEEDLANLRQRASRHDVEQIVTDLVEGMAAQGTPLDPAMLGM